MARLEVKLKQHTPMIHFQSHLIGATLRGTELKPKLDKYLIEKGFGGNFSDYKKHLIGYKKDDDNKNMQLKKALNYKVSITALSKEKFIEDIDKNGKCKQYPCFFANMGKRADDTKRIKFSENSDLEISFFSFSSELIDKIKEHIADFFMKNNFGTRQSKGFGSYYIDSNDVCYKSPKLAYSFEVSTTDYKVVFDKIDLFYKTLRSGINDSRDNTSKFYFKSLMFLYAKDKGIQWDKKSIKEVFLPNQLNEQIRKHNGNDILSFSSNKKKIMKDLLGLSSSEKWGSYNLNIEKGNNSIARFKSPILFKPIKEENKFIVYFDAIADISNEILGREFSISASQRSMNLSFPTREDLKLSPDRNIIIDFLEFALTVDLDRHVDDAYKKYQNKFNNIKAIYKSINDRRTKTSGK